MSKTSPVIMATERRYPDDYVLLIDKLLLSTNLPTQTAIDQVQAKEVKQRLQERGNVKGKIIHGEQIFEKSGKRFSNSTLSITL